MKRPRLLTVFQVLSAITVPVLLAGNFAAVWGLGDRFFYWSSTVAAMSWLIGGFAALTIIWTIAWTWVDAVREFGDKGGDHGR